MTYEGSWQEHELNWLSSLLRATIKKNLRTCEECLPHIKFAYNRVVLNVAQLSPFEIDYGFNFFRFVTIN